MEFWVEIQGSYFNIGMEISNLTCFFMDKVQRGNDSEIPDYQTLVFIVPKLGL